jgi:hypothetical protein
VAIGFNYDRNRQAVADRGLGTMNRFLVISIAAVLLAPIAAPTSVEAGWRGSKSSSAKSRSRGAKVRGYRKRRGQYSYSANDVANTYGNSRTRYGSVNSYRDHRQTNAGPFDHGWFFDSAVAPRGGDSPYMQ